MSSGPNCFKCEHFFISWDPSRPKGCRAYNMKCMEIPSVMVRKVSGTPCQLFKLKERIKEKEEQEKNNDLNSSKYWKA